MQLVRMNWDLVRSCKLNNYYCTIKFDSSHFFFLESEVEMNTLGISTFISTLIRCHSECLYDHSV